MALLIVEDETVLARAMKRALERAGHEVVTEESAEAGLEVLHAECPDLILCDLRLPGMSGLDFLREVREQGHEMPFLLMTAHGTVQNAVEAMRLGAYDYLTKPIDLDELRLVVARALEHARRARELAYFRERDRRHSGAPLALGASPVMREVEERVERVARLERQPGGGAPAVLVLGETGTGKGLVARAIHDRSPRAAGAFIDVNCTALPGPLLEAEVFGYEKGAFTDAKTTRRGLFEAADGGTLFLDEIGHLDLSAQSKLLKVIEEKTFRRLGSNAQRRADVRIIAATSRDLPAAQASGAFRPDLFHRLSVLTIELPPLRERGDDVVRLAEHFVRHHAEQYGLEPRPLGAVALDVLRRHPWPGNVRELSNEIEKAVLLETGPDLTLRHLAKSAPTAPREPVRIAGAPDGVEVSLPPDGVPFEEIERRILERALAGDGRQHHARGALPLALTRRAALPDRAPPDRRAPGGLPRPGWVKRPTGSPPPRHLLPRAHSAWRSLFCRRALARQPLIPSSGERLAPWLPCSRAMRRQGKRKGGQPAMLDDKTIESPEVDRIQDALLRAVSGLATAVAHEVNNPLTALKGHLELLLPHLPGHLAAEYVAPAMEAAESIERIVRAMNGIVRVEFAPDAVAPMPEMLDLLGCAGSRAA